MARNGVWELREVLLRYCANSGSSRGVRDFVEHGLVSFARKNPHIQFQTEIKGGHPCVFCKYVTGYERQRTLKNISAEEVGETLQLLRDTLGRRVPAHNQLGTGVVEKRAVSVQGVWRNRADLNPPETAETLELREKRRQEYSVDSIIEKYGVTGLVKITQSLLENRERMRLAALAAMPKKERVMPTE
ncbi:unnamed protein product [Agarophyton chilense]|eukprot:gb/GEZJ01005927.1/.p1 GENE.gb/GEZJ01005927.1/~~gb/GEZJ01005927.1/.p1  ORF type:complete len:188 (-),score=13.12 gb/GEZJ01005927.1/:219-782(-)